MDIVEFSVMGRPEPGGSKTAYAVRNQRWQHGSSKLLRYLHDGDGRPIVNTVDANDKKVRPWKKAVSTAAQQAYSGPLLDGALLVEMTFLVHRAKGHYGTGKNARVLKASAPLFPATNPDLLKLTRPVEDALTGIVWTDDGRTVDFVLRERFAEGYCLDGMPGTGVIVRIAQHEHTTVGEALEAAQETLAIA